MRIDQGISSFYDIASTSAAKGVATASEQSGAVSKSSRTGDAASVTLSSDDSLRDKRIEALTLQVQSGTYKVDARAVASFMFAAQFGDK